MGSSVRDLQASTSSVILRNHVHPTDDAKEERAKANFDVAVMSQFLNGGLQNIKKRQKFARELEQLPWAKKDDRYFLTREEEYVKALRAATQIWSKMMAKEIDVEEALQLRLMVDFPGGLELHIGMFIPTILGQGTEEQKKELLPKCNSLEIIGTYAQTELGHGTFLRGLETTATFVQSSGQFIIHSPTPTATKWWPGGMGKTATHAVVMARLFVSGKDYGPHAFIVQLRDLKTHKSLPGIVVGDIGPKFGYNGVDNGFLRFDHVMVPHGAMLSRFSQVTTDGKYIPPPPDNQKAMYSTMLFVRADIVRHSSKYLARAATISVRYCCVRRQTAPSPKERELQVIDYDNTATTLLPILAASYVLHAVGKAIWAAYELYESEKKQGRYGTLPELHASSSGLKAVCTEVAADGIEACRRACGGHGYSVLSGLPTLYASYVQNVTWEGDNNVLLLQTARFLLKVASAVEMQQPGMEVPASLMYFTNEVAGPVAVGETGWIKKVLTALARNSVRSALTDLMKHPDSGGKVVFDGPAWNKCTVSMIAAARSHILCVMLESYEAFVKCASGAPAANMAVLQQLGELWAVDVIIKNMGGVLESGVLKTTEAYKVRSLRRQLQQKLRPNAISLVDSWAFTDYELNSALGRQDGDVYTALFDMAQGSPLNKTDEGPAWEAVMKPVIQKLQRAKL